MGIIFVGLVAALVTVVVLLPQPVSFGDAVYLAGAAGRLNAVTTNFNWTDRFNIWSGLIGSTFLFLSYFGCDQSQVQRYLTGRSIAESRISLLFNAVAKIPMQFFILFIGAMVFVFYLFTQPPVLFQQSELGRIRKTEAFGPLEVEYNAAFGRRSEAALALAAAHRAGDPAGEQRLVEEYRAAQKELDSVRVRAAKMVERTGGPKAFNDTNYIFLSFVTHYLPAGLVGLVIAVVFAATMSATSGEINSLATVTVVDIYRRYVRREASDRHYLAASRWATLFWGGYAVAFAGWGKKPDSLIVAVNVVGSLFYGTLLGCFVAAFAFRRVGGTAIFIGMLAGESVVLATYFYTDISDLWLCVIGCAVVLATALAITGAISATPARRSSG
jgi:Na+/proline symporter